MKPVDFGVGSVLVYFVTLGLFTYSLRDRPLRFGLGIAATLVVTATVGTSVNMISCERSFFGVYTVRTTEAGDFIRDSPDGSPQLPTIVERRAFASHLRS